MICSEFGFTKLFVFHQPLPRPLKFFIRASPMGFIKNRLYYNSHPTYRSPFALFRIPEIISRRN